MARLDALPVSATSGWRLIRLALYNYAIHFSRYIIPLLLLPYLSRTLGPAGYGAVAFATSFGVLLSLFVEFGFSLSATRELARHRNNHEHVARIVADVLGAKALLTFIVLTIGLLAADFLPRFQAEPAFAYGGLLYAIAVGFSPLWFFQAAENVGVQSALEVGAQIGAAALIFLFVGAPEDAALVLPLQAGGALFSTGAGYMLLYRHRAFNVRFFLPTLSGSLSAIRMSGALFLLQGFIMLYTTVNVLLVGMLLTNSQAGYYGAAERLFSAICGLYSPFALTVFPRMNFLLAHAPERAFRLATVGLAFLLGLSATCVVIVWLVAPFAIGLIFGAEFEASIPVLKILSLSLPMIAVSQILGLQCMLPLRMDKAFNVIIGVGGVLNVALGLFLVPLEGIIGMAFSRLATEGFATLAMLVVLVRRQADVKAAFAGVDDAGGASVGAIEKTEGGMAQ